MVGFHILSRGLLYLDEVLDGTGAFIVKYMELGCVADCLQVCVDAGEGLHHAGVLLGFHCAEVIALHL